jgi:hypothetical protein
MVSFSEGRAATKLEAMRMMADAVIFIFARVWGLEGVGDRMKSRKGEHVGARHKSGPTPDFRDGLTIPPLAQAMTCTVSPWPSEDTREPESRHIPAALHDKT